MLTNLTMQRKSPSVSGSLLSNTVANPRGNLKAITTLSGVAYEGPSIPPTTSSLPKEVKRELKVTKDKVQTTSSESTAHVKPPVVQVPIRSPKLLRSLILNRRFLILREDFAPELNPTSMTLKLANRSVSYPFGVVEDVFMKVGTFYFLAVFAVVDYDVDPRVPLILGRPFLRTARALINIHGEELTLQVNDKTITFKAMYTSRYSRNYYEELVNRIDVINVSYNDYYDTKGDILYPEKLLNKDLSSNFPLMKNEDLKQINVTMTKPSIEEPPKLKLKDLPSHLEYAFLEGTNKLPIIISKELKDKENATLLKVLKSHKRAIAWKIFNIKGIDPCFCTHKILMEDDFIPAVQHQRRVNMKIHEVIK
nr:hypothetical protein [Tanacetum cinerariifolium]